MRIMILSAMGLVATVAMPASAEAQYGHGYYAGQDYRGITKVEREYRKKFAEERRECSKKQREADSRREWLKAQRECRKKLFEVEREYRKELREASRKSYEGRRGDRYNGDDDDD